MIFTTSDGVRLTVEHKGKASEDNQDIKEILKYAFLSINWGIDEYDIKDIEAVEIPEMGFQTMPLPEALALAGLTAQGDIL